MRALGTLVSSAQRAAALARKYGARCRSGTWRGVRKEGCACRVPCALLPPGSSSTPAASTRDPFPPAAGVRSVRRTPPVLPPFPASLHLSPPLAAYRICAERHRGRRGEHQCQCVAAGRVRGGAAGGQLPPHAAVAHHEIQRSHGTLQCVSREIGTTRTVYWRADEVWQL